MSSDQIETEVVNLTPSAAQAVKDLLAQRNLQDQGYALRVFVAGSSCSGLQYGMALDKDIRPQDLQAVYDGVTVIVDEVSILYMRGATIDFVETPTGSGFKIENPNAVSNCGGGCSGCG